MVVKEELGFEDMGTGVVVEEELGAGVVVAVEGSGVVVVEVGTGVVGGYEVVEAGVVEDDGGCVHAVWMRSSCVDLVSAPMSPVMTISSPAGNSECAASITVMVL